MPYVERSLGVIVNEFYDEKSYATEFLADGDVELEAFRNANVGALTLQDQFNLNVASLLVDTGNTAQLIAPNYFSDGFADTSGVDLVNSVDISTANVGGGVPPLGGYILPVRNTPTTITLNAGMLAGNMSGNGGFAAIVSGGTENYASAGVAALSTEGWFSVTFVEPAPIFDASLRGSTDRGYTFSNTSQSVLLEMYGKIGATPPTGPTDPGLILLHSTTVTDFGDIITLLTPDDQATFFDHILFRIVGPSSGIACANVTIRKSGAYKAMALKSTPKTADTVPRVAMAAMTLVVPNDCILGTDIKLSFSRDGAVTRTYAVLSEELVPYVGQALPPYHKVIAVSTLQTDLSSQPSGTDVRYWVETLSKYGQHRVNNFTISWGI